MEKFEQNLYKLLSYICGLLILVMTILIFSQVVARYVLNNSLTWSEELGRYLFVWITFIGLPVALKAKAHVALDILLRKTKGKFHLAILVINTLLTMLLSVVIFYSGFKLINVGIGQISSALQIPMQYVYSILPVSGILLLFFSVTCFISEYKSLEKEK